MKRIIRLFFILLTTILGIYLFCCVMNRFHESENPADVSDTYAIYYLVNADGMKGLGHSIILLTGPDDKKPDSCVVYSFNGMEKNLKQALMGEAGVGCLSVSHLTKEEVDSFLTSGDIFAGTEQLNANYDLAVYKEIECEEYREIADKVSVYIQLTDAFHKLEEKQDKEGIATLKAQNDALLYRIYSHNCDTVARELLETIDPDVQEFNVSKNYYTPLANIKAFSREMDDWSSRKIGNQSVKEKLFTFFMIF